MVPLEFSEGSQAALKAARHLARKRRADYIEVEHIALAVLDQAPASALLLAFGRAPDLERLREEIFAASGPVQPGLPMPVWDIPYSQAAVAVVRGALAAAEAFMSLTALPSKVGPGYLLIGVLCPVDESDREPIKTHAAAAILRSYGLDERLIADALSMFEPHVA